MIKWVLHYVEPILSFCKKLNFAIHFFVDIFVKTYIIMTNKEKYEMWGKVATAMAEEKRIIQEVGIERAKTEYGIKFAKLREPRVSENK